MTQEDKKARTFLRNIITKQQDALIAITRTLVKTPSPNPAGNTVLVADAAIKLLQSIPHAHVSRHETAPGLVNVVARIPSGRPGKRLVFNGHLDTYPLCEDLNWTVPPLGGVLKDGRLYGRGVCDMKGGIAASITAAKLLAEHRDLWRGEIVVTLAGDEECMGSRGAKWLLDNVEAAKGDAMICGDAGSPQVVRFGEKGFVWIDVEAKGVAAHGAHVHRGLNAVNRLRKALDAIETLEEMAVDMPAEVEDAIDAAADVSQASSGMGELDTLRHVTVNIGTVHGGVSPNLIPAHAKAECDLRLPLGVTTEEILAKLRTLLDPMEGIRWRIIRKCDPNYTSPTHDIVQLGLKVSKEVTGGKSVASIRVGASDTRWYRAAGIPTVVVGCSGGNMGGADEYVEVKELVQVAQAHTLMAYDFLKGC
ncbi:uncharacterized protein CIMG_03403 [Coccidioides immitis RS]|uniref:Peptidase M20 dimerisation domain-containing protein n=1 Tax=Coccidioides immitis (strain RS) TaxID=246410 RepID=J3KBA0_COCIM|nr:uncharacterized protein CIMG_03403 [Coccidioides immitis RS]EAS32379.3 hypothetical protein CIMG_03403 [Coccidioides immitis RS]TPX19520.1 hypothetical protein DIZ76_017312 [Coccidioides immitis]